MENKDKQVNISFVYELKEIKPYVYYVAFACVVIVASYVIPELYECVKNGACHFDIGDLVHEFLRDIGIALIVGVFIGLVLETKHRKKIQDDNASHIDRYEREFNEHKELYQREFSEYKKTIGQHFLYAIYARRHPHRLLEIIKETIFDKPLLRTDAVISLRLKDFSEGLSGVPDNLKCRLHSFRDTIDANSFLREEYLLIMKVNWSFGIVNLSDDEQRFPASFCMQVPFDCSLANLCDVFSIIVDGEQRIGDFDRNCCSGEVVYTLKKDASPIFVKKDEELRVEYEALSVRWRDDKETFNMILPTKGLLVFVEDESGNKNISIKPNFYTKDDPSTKYKVAENNKARLGTKDFLLPYQGVVVRWMPYRTEITNSSAQAKAGLPDLASPSSRESA